MLQSFQNSDNMKTFNEQPDMNFAAMAQNQILYIAFVHTNIKRAQAYGMLSDIAAEFTAKFPGDSVKFAQQFQYQRDM